MSFQPDVLKASSIVTAYDDSSVTIDGVMHRSSVVCGTDLLPRAWAAAADLSAAVVTATPAGTEVVLLGTGKHQVFPEVAVREAWLAAGVAVEIMDTAAACRTYNILRAEGRRVLAILQIDSNGA
ncbi:MAG: Mth938-like domain-containing protein [Burkholderiaceae bacterium]